MTEPACLPAGSGRRPVVALLVSLVALAVGTVAATPALALPAQPAETVLQLDVVSQTAVVEPDGALELAIDVGPAIERFGSTEADPVELTDDGTADNESGDGEAADGEAALTVAVVVHSVLDEEEDLALVPSRPLNRRPEVPLTEVLAADGATVDLRVPVRDGDPFDDEDRVRVPDPGVYPVVVEIRSGDVLVAEAVTQFVRLPTDSGRGEGPDSYLAEAGVVLFVASRDGLRPAEAATLLESHPDLPMLVVVEDSAITELTSNPALASRFRDAVGSRTVVPVPDRGLDPSALAAIGKHAFYMDAMADSRTSMAALGLMPAPDITSVDGPLTVEGIRVLADLGITKVVDTDAPAGVLDSGDGRRLAVLNPDGPASADLEMGTSGPVRASGILARLAFRRRDDVVIIGTAVRSTGLFDALDNLLATFEEQDAARITDLTTLTPERIGPALEPAVGPVTDLSAAIGPLDEAQRALGTYASFYVDGPGPPVDFQQELTDALGAGASDAQLVARIRGIAEEIDGVTDVISLPENQSVTLAAQSVQIPLTIQSQAEGNRSVLLRFESDKIEVAEDGTQITVAPGTNTINIAVTARSLGAFPLEVSVLTPDGARELASTRFQVRSTAVPGLGLAISAVGLGLLGVWWFLSIRRRGSSGSGADSHGVSGGGTPPGRSGDGAGAGGPATGEGEVSGSGAGPGRSVGTEAAVDRDGALAGDSVSS